MNVEEFRALHVPGDPLFLVNAWDFSSARWLHGNGFAVLGTTSLGVAHGAGLVDGTGATSQQTRELARRLTATGIPLSVDVEAGFSDDPQAVGDLVTDLAALGVLGVNLEDSRPGGSLLPVGLAAAKVAAAADSGLFVNARTDTCWRVSDRPTRDLGHETRERARAYTEAGADGIFVPGLTAPATIADLAATLDRPLNVLVCPDGPTVPELAASGVSRISCGSFLFRRAMGSVVDAARALQRGEPAGVAPGYAEFVD